MILPSKHISLAESLLGLGGVLLEILMKQPCSLDSLWQEYSKINNRKEVFPAYHSFDNVILAVDLLFIIGAVNINSEGEIYRYEIT
ncbi:hypothetical protein AGMMS49574_17990 [Bacteroidia bacterium]|nr:hypothetical protein AGMMS49574_17990 [Bacteroidia bacterium]